MTAGELRERVTVQVLSQQPDGHDGFLPDQWAPVSPARRAAKVEPLAGKAMDRARQIEPLASHDVTVRYWPTYRATCPAPAKFRIVWHDGPASRVLEPIEPWREPEPREALTVACRELVA